MHRQALPANRPLPLKGQRAFVGSAVAVRTLGRRPEDRKGGTPPGKDGA